MAAVGGGAGAGVGIYYAVKDSSEKDGKTKGQDAVNEDPQTQAVGGSSSTVNPKSTESKQQQTQISQSPVVDEDGAKGK